MGGSFYVEYLTAKIEEEVEKYLKKIERMGNILAAIREGLFSRRNKTKCIPIKERDR